MRSAPRTFSAREISRFVAPGCVAKCARTLSFVTGVGARGRFLAKAAISNGLARILRRIRRFCVDDIRLCRYGSFATTRTVKRRPIPRKPLRGIEGDDAAVEMHGARTGREVDGHEPPVCGFSNAPRSHNWPPATRLRRCGCPAADRCRPGPLRPIPAPQTRQRARMCGKRISSEFPHQSRTIANPTSYWKARAPNKTRRQFQ